MSKIIETQAEKHMYEQLERQLYYNQSLNILNQLLDVAYNKGRKDLAKEISPKIKLRHGVFTRNKSKGREYIDDLTKDKVIIEKRGIRNDYYVKCVDAEYQLCSFSNAARGHKFHYAHVDNESLQEDSDYEILHSVIKPTLSIAYQLYDECEEDRREDHLIYF